MPYQIAAVPLDELRDLANSARPTRLAFGVEPGALPPDFVAAVSLKLLEEGGPAWCTTYYIVRRSDGAVVGSGCFKRLPVEGSVEIGYGVAPSARNQGAATHAVKALVKLAGENGITRVWAEVESGNAASARVLASAGFGLVGSREDAEDGLVGIWVAPPAPREA